LLFLKLVFQWEQFLQTQPGVDPLIKMTISHYQFEAIHPFQGGNGRTGRILNTLYLVEQELLTLPILYLKTIYIGNKFPASEADLFYEIKIVLLAIASPCLA